MANATLPSDQLIMIAKFKPEDLKLDAKENSELVLVDWHQKDEKTQAAQ